MLKWSGLVSSDVLLKESWGFDSRKLKKNREGRVEKECLMALKHVAQLVVVINTDKAKDRGKTKGRNLCYHVLGRVHGFWPPIPGMIKDYISTPKINGYQVAPALQWLPV